MTSTRRRVCRTQSFIRETTMTVPTMRITTEAQKTLRARAKHDWALQQKYWKEGLQYIYSILRSK
ncbi:hypothetical protein [Pseudomonas phage LUZ7]|uniref:Uncharacterized protein n=1 Tax=Pseudomonas phage LUZ7 TaxID=655097 RepID=C8ZKB6_9CAUD|nr:hypothetical protein PP-LUZ7_gp017 [Pseudomonas phage LUZ7]CAZ66158.1 hypothetical protein [Pseudomonas phage LUZ7]